MNAKQPQLIYSSTPHEELPLLSIVTLCYNTGHFVVEGMTALLPQLTDQVEHVILDDGSGDESVQLLVNFAKSNGYPVRIYANTENCGITESKSRILKLVKGEFIAGCADDIFLPERIDHDLKMIASLPDHAAGFYSWVLPFSVNADGVRHYHQHPLGGLQGLNEHTILAGTELVNQLRRGNFIPAMGVCLRKSVYDAFPQDTSYFIEDYPMWAKLAQSGWGLAYSPMVNTLYRRGSHSIQKTQSLKVDFDVIRVQLEILNVGLSSFDKQMKMTWFRVVCDADNEMISRLVAICNITSNRGGILLFVAKMKLSRRLRWVLSNLSLKFDFWKYI